MKALRKTVLVVLCLVGVGLLAGGVYGFCSLAEAADDYVLATGVVEKVNPQFADKRRADRVERVVGVCYDTSLYGEVCTPLDSYASSLLAEGDKVDILYNPRLPHLIRLPGWESLLYSLLAGVGLLLGGGCGWLLRPRPRRG